MSDSGNSVTLRVGDYVRTDRVYGGATYRPYAWLSMWGVNTSLPAIVRLVVVPLPTLQCERCGRFRRESRVPRHICPAMLRKRRHLKRTR